MTRITLSLIFVLFILSPLQVKAQLKIGHINTNVLIATMPEADSAKSALKAMSEQLARTEEELRVEYNKAYVDYESKVDSMSSLVRKTKEAALTDMMRRIQEFGENSQQELQLTQENLFQPILIKAQNAIQAVADELGFDYVLDTGTGAVLSVPKDRSLDILSLVQAKLGIKTE